jgi:hypothetical protein
MTVPLVEICDCVRQSSDPPAALKALRELGKSRLKSELWDAVADPDWEADVRAAAAWLKKNISKPRPTGVYLGLDIFNERGGKGQNIEIGWTSDLDPQQLTMEWVTQGLDYGDHHLIGGLYEIHKSYSEFELDDAVSLPDYVFYLGYSGIVMIKALEQVPVRWDSLFVWGFHDDDQAFLARCSASGVERIAKF